MCYRFRPLWNDRWNENGSTNPNWNPSWSWWVYFHYRNRQILQIKACFIFLLIVQSRSQEPFSVKCQRRNISGFVGHAVSLFSNYARPGYGTQAALDHTWSHHPGWVHHDFFMHTKSWLSYNSHMSWNILLLNIFSHLKMLKPCLSWPYFFYWSLV